MRRAFALAITTMILAGCGSTPVDSAVIVLDEYSIELSAPVIQTGPVVLAVENAGEFSHTLVVTRADGSAVVATETIAPGSAVELPLDLEPGGYQVSCRIVVQLPDGTIVDHYEQGMLASMEVAER
ncbi:MAG: hypothetical protein WEE36_01695 [Acidimicrobiia bacterium]